MDTSIVKSNPPAEETPLQITSDRIGTIDISAYTNGKTLFVPIGELFSFLKINFNITENNTVINGFYLYEKIKYSINIPENVASIGERKIFVRRKEFYITETDIYIKSDIFETLFGIKLDFDFNQLKVFLSSKSKLPAEVEKERDILRSNMETKLGEKSKADINLKRKRKALGLGVMDWMLSYNHTSPKNDFYSYNLSLGSEILGGDLNALVTGSKEKLLNNDNTNWRWRYVDNKKFFRQGVLGNVNLNSGLLYNVQGFQLTNSPPVARRTIGKYKIFDQTNPKWKVELYINNEYIDHTISNENGYFEFNVPLLYGSNYITLRYYGPSGEIKSEERVIQVPFNFIPEKTVEYSVSGGTLKSGRYNAFSESSVFWGITQSLTTGTGLVYLNAPGEKKFYPNANLSYRINDNLVFNSTYFHELKGSINLSLLLPSQIFGTISYIRYGKNEFFNPEKYNEERNISAYFPLAIKCVSTSYRVSVRNILSDNHDFIFLNSGLFVNYFRLQASFSTNGTWTKTTSNYKESGLSSSLGLSYRLLSDLMLRQQTNLNHSNGRVMSAGINIDKSIFNSGWLTLFVTRDFERNDYFGGITFRFDLSFGRYSSGYYSSGNEWSMSQSIYGSAGYDQFKNKFIMDNQNMVSRGGLTLVPFIDYNNNNKLDNNEKILSSGFKSSMNSGKVIKSQDKNDTWYVGLEPYDTYRLEINPQSFDNPLYRPKYESYSVTVDPNHFKEIPVPVFISGIISGNVWQKTETEAKGVSMFKVILESLDGKLKFEKLSFSDGEFIFDNIPPGKYKLYPDYNDLIKRSLTSETEYKIIEIKNLEDGDIRDGLDIFVVKK